MTFRLIFIGLLLWLPFVVSADALGPQELVKETATRVLAEVMANKDELLQSPEHIYPLVEVHILPSFDFRLMSKLVLGKYWKRATEEEQGEFTSGFRQLLVRTYATALLNYSGEEVKYPDVKVPDDARRINVPTEIISSPEAPPIPIVYSLYVKDGIWKVYDLKIDGISMVSNYRTSFAGQIKRHKLSGLIARIDKKNGKGVK